MKTDGGIQIPANRVGKSVDLVHTVIAENEAEAMKTFRRACKRLLNPEVWKEISGMFSASFHLVNAGAVDPHRLAIVGDHLKINIPGPGNSDANGYDWVQVTAINEHSDPAIDEFVMELRASINPANPEVGVAHFFKEGASSTFVVKRNGNTVTGFYYGRNEVANREDVSTGNKIRNTLVAALARAGISGLQWTALLKGILEKEL